MNKKREEILRRIRDFRLFDDDFMTKCFEDDHKCTELVLRIIMQKPDLTVKESRAQYTLKNLQGRSVRLDVFAIDSKKKQYNIEIQRAERGAEAKRARYNSSLLDANALMKGYGTNQLPETYIIFITERDVLKRNKPIYHIRRYIEETGEPFEDGTHIIYVNGGYTDDTPLGRLMKDFSCSNPSDMYYKILADRARYFKEEKEGLELMCKSMEEFYAGAVKDSMIDAAKRMLKDGALTLEKIAEYAGLSIEEVEGLMAEEQ